jgi:hypothetical protein
MNMLDVYIPILTYFGCNRMQRFIRLMAVEHHTSIIDVGGTPYYMAIYMAINRVSAVGHDDQCVNAMIDR